MQKMLFASAILFGGLVATAAGAMPVVSFAKSTSSAVQVDYACGRGAHLNPYGRCRPNHWGPPPEVVYHHRRDDWNGSRHNWHGDDQQDWRRDDRRREYYNN